MTAGAPVRCRRFHGFTQRGPGGLSRVPNHGPGASYFFPAALTASIAFMMRLSETG